MIGPHLTPGHSSNVCFPTAQVLTKAGKRQWEKFLHVHKLWRSQTSQQRQRGVSHAQALRALGQRWIKIIWRMWHDHTTYDANLHLKNQIAYGSWLLKVAQK